MGDVAQQEQLEHIVLQPEALNHLAPGETVEEHLKHLPSSQPLPGDYVTPNDFHTLDDYNSYIEHHPTQETAVGASLEVGLTGIKIVGDYWFIALVLLALPALYYVKKRIDLRFHRKVAK